MAFYRTADGRLLARPVDRFERPGTKLFRARYRSQKICTLLASQYVIHKHQVGGSRLRVS
ncbi:hypothetical protein SO3561_10329 [Streptomyces olivochromogenes]|uniref:Uncharacterized protein n=1 Tax=Streptomyces olivochromogenes TaxID=1963 RepID=A0A286PGS5_STROL|nr:hypothetical protein SO3561_10329 [Streptomyces olivochromogenes]